MRKVSQQNKTCELTVAGMDCADCARKIEKNVANLKGVKSAAVDFINSRLAVEFEDEPNLKAVERVVKSMGYTIGKEAETKSSTFIVKGMDYADEERAIRKKLESMEGLQELKFNLVAQKLTVIHQLTEQKIIRSLREIGFEAVPEGKEKTVTSFWGKHKRLILTIISGLFTTAGIIHNQLHVPDSFTIPLYLVAILSGGFYVARKGLLAVKNLSLDINFLMTLAVVGAAIIGEWDEGAVVIFLFAVANLLESYSMDRARNAIKSLMDLSPKVATVKRNGEQIELPVEEVGIGDVMIVKPGERIPLDGVVIGGRSTVNQAPITGEFMPVKKKVT
ncbi:MAG: cation transporter, partial [bacterium]